MTTYTYQSVGELILFKWTVIYLHRRTWPWETRRSHVPSHQRHLSPRTS